MAVVNDLLARLVGTAPRPMPTAPPGAVSSRKDIAEEKPAKPKKDAQSQVETDDQESDVADDGQDDASVEESEDTGESAASNGKEKAIPKELQEWKSGIEKQLAAASREASSWKSKAQQSDADNAKMLRMLEERLGGTTKPSADDDELEDDKLVYGRDVKEREARKAVKDRTAREQDNLNTLNRRIQAAVARKKDLAAVVPYFQEKLSDHEDRPFLNEMGAYYLAQSHMLQDELEKTKKVHKEELDKLKAQVRKPKPPYPGVSSTRGQTPEEQLGALQQRSKSRGIRLDRDGNFIPAKS